MYITIAKPPVNDIAFFDKVTSSFTEPQGMLFRYAGPDGDGTLRVVSGWESQAHAERFFADTLAPALARVLGPEPAGRPEGLGIDVARAYQAQGA